MRSYLKFLLIISVALLAASPIILLKAERSNEITPNDEFFEVYYSYQPEIIAAEWDLSVIGLVDDPLVLSYDELLSLENTSNAVTLTCVTGGTGTAEWTGVRLTDLLGMAGVSDGAQEVVFYSADGYTTSLTMEEIEKDVILAWGMNGVPLPMEQGFPLRVVAPDQYGYKWAMWVEAVEVVDNDHRGYWESRGWSDDASISLERDWWTHSFLFTVGGVFGAFAALSGISFKERWWRGFFDRDVHRFTAIAYTLILTLTLIYWVWQTIDLRGEVFYSTHGMLALGAFLSNMLGIAVLPFRKRWDVIRSMHCYSIALSLTFFLLAILSGLTLALP